MAESETDPVQKWLERIAERDLTSAVRAMLIATGAETVILIHGPQETGRDLIFREADRFGQRRWKAVQIRAGRQAWLRTPRSIAAFFARSRQAIEAPFVDADGNDHSVDQLLVMLPMALPADVRNEIDRVSIRFRNIVVLDGPVLVDLFAKHTPNVVGATRAPEASIVQIVPNISPQLLQALREDPAKLRQLSAERFEQFVADRLDKMGYDVTLTGPTTRKDGGVDVIAVPRAAGAGTYLLAGQVKHHSGDQTTGRDAVDRLISLKNGQFRLGLLVTNTTFTKDAEWAAAKDDNKFFARLRDFDDIKRWLEDDFTGRREFREIPDEIEIAPGIRIKVPRPPPPKQLTTARTRR